MIISTPDEGEATGYVADIYQSDIDNDGFVAWHTKVMAVNPEAHAALNALVRTIIPSIGKRNYQLVTLAAARAIRSPHCLLGYGRVALRAEVLDEDQLTRAMTDFSDAGLSDAEVAMMTFAEKQSTNPSAMTDADSQVLRDHGFSDRQILDIALAAGVRNYFSRSLLALAVPFNDLPGLSPSMHEVLLAPTAR